MNSTLYEEDASMTTAQGVGHSSQWALLPVEYASSGLDSEVMAYDCMAFNAATGASWTLDMPVITRSVSTLDALWADDGRLYVHVPDAIAAYDTSGKTLFTVDASAGRLMGMGLSDGILWVCFMQGDKLLLRWHDTGTGKTLQECTPDVTINPDITQMNVCLTPVANSSDEGAPYYAFTFDSQTAIIDRTGAVYQLVEACYGYGPTMDRFLVERVSVSDSAIGTYQRYGLDELISRAQDQLAGSRMSEEQRQALGLS